MSFSPEQLTAGLIQDRRLKDAARQKNATNFATPPQSRDWSNIFDIQHEDILAGMFGKIDDPLANFPPSLAFLRSTLFAPVIGRPINSDEIPALLSLASKVTNPDLTVRSLYALEQVIEEGLKPEHIRLVEDAERLLCELKARCPGVVEAREEARKTRAHTFKELAEMSAQGS